MRPIILSRIFQKERDDGGVVLRIALRELSPNVNYSLESSSFLLHFLLVLSVSQCPTIHSQVHNVPRTNFLNIASEAAPFQPGSD